MRSTNGGISWTAIVLGANFVFPHVDQHAMAFGFSGPTATRLYIGNDGGAWSTDVAVQSGPINWTNLNNTLNITQFYPGHSIHPSDDQIGFGGTQDNSTQKFTGTLAWTAVTCGDGGWTAIDPQVPSTVYATCQDIDIRKSTVNGNPGTFFFADFGISFTDRVAFIPPFVIDPAMPQRLYFGTFRVYQTTNGAAFWTAVSNDLTGAAGTLSTIAVAPKNSNTVYAGTSNGLVWVCPTAGATTPDCWSNITRANLPNRAATQIAVDPNDATGKIAYATFSGFSGTFPPAPPDTKGHVFKTEDGGLTWLDISGIGAGALLNTPVNDIAIDPDDPTGKTLYVGTDVGVFRTTDGGGTWTTLVPGLPRVAVLSLKLRRESRTLRAATHGRGVWDLKLPNLEGTPTFNLSSIQPSTAAAGAGFTLTVNGNGFTASSVVKWNGATQPTTPVSANQLTATIPASLLANVGTAQVTVDQSGSGPISNVLIFTVTVAPPANDDVLAAIDATPTPFTDMKDTTAATTDTGGRIDPTPSILCVGFPGAGRAHTVWYKFTPTSNGTITADTATSNYDTVLSVWTGTPGSFTNQVACNDDVDFPFDLTSRVSFAATSGKQYFFMVAGFSNFDFGNSVFHLSFTTGPPDFTLATTPGQTSRTVNAGQQAQYPIGVLAFNGFTGTVNLTCSLPAAATTCTVSPASVTTSGSATVTVTTTERSFLPPGGFSRRVGPWPKTVPIVLLAMLALSLLALFARARRRRLALAATLGIFVLLLVFHAAGCGSAGSNPPPPPPPQGTPAGTYTVTVTGTSGSTTRTANLTLIVN